MNKNPALLQIKGKNEAVSSKLLRPAPKKKRIRTVPILFILLRKGMSYCKAPSLLTLGAIIFSSLILQRAEAAITIYPAFNGSEYSYDAGKYPDAPRSTFTYASVRNSGKALIMTGAQGASTVEYVTEVEGLGKYNHFGVYVSQPLSGDENITDAMT